MRLLNKDSVSKDGARAGCHGLFRVSKDEWLCCFANSLETSSVVLWGVLEGLAPKFISESS